MKKLVNRNPILLYFFLVILVGVNVSAKGNDASSPIPTLTGIMRTAVHKTVKEKTYRLAFELAKPGTVEIRIKDSHNKTLYSNTVRFKATYSETYNFKALKPGTYMVEFTDDMGEKAFQVITLS